MQKLGRVRDEAHNRALHGLCKLQISTALVRVKASKGEKGMKDEFYDYGNKQPRPTLKGILIHFCVWGLAAGLFVIGAILNGGITL